MGSLTLKAQTAATFPSVKSFNRKRGSDGQRGDLQPRVSLGTYALHGDRAGQQSLEIGIHPRFSQRPRERNGVARDTRALVREIRSAKQRFRLPGNSKCSVAAKPIEKASPARTSGQCGCTATRSTVESTTSWSTPAAWKPERGAAPQRLTAST